MLLGSLKKYCVIDRPGFEIKFLIAMKKFIIDNNKNYCVCWHTNGPAQFNQVSACQTEIFCNL